MSFGGYDAFDDPYAYRGLDCLKNRAGIRDPEALQRFELEMTSLRAEEPLPYGRFGAAHYRAVHRHLFQDVYRWAGRYRTIRTAKDGNWFCFPEHIRGQMDELFSRPREALFLPGAAEADFLRAAARFLADLNAIHPFREGNGRSQLAFMHLVGLRAGWPLSFERVRPDSFLSAMIASFDGDLEPLVIELASLRD